MHSLKTIRWTNQMTVKRTSCKLKYKLFFDTLCYSFTCHSRRSTSFHVCKVELNKQHVNMWSFWNHDLQHYSFHWCLYAVCGMWWRKWRRRKKTNNRWLELMAESFGSGILSYTSFFSPYRIYRSQKIYTHTQMSWMTFKYRTCVAHMLRLERLAKFNDMMSSQHLSECSSIMLLKFSLMESSWHVLRSPFSVHRIAYMANEILNKTGNCCSIHADNLFLIIIENECKKHNNRLSFKFIDGVRVA